MPTSFYWYNLDYINCNACSWMLPTCTDCVCNTAVLTQFFWPGYCSVQQAFGFPLTLTEHIFYFGLFARIMTATESLFRLWTFSEPSYFSLQKTLWAPVSLSVILRLLVYFISVWPSIYGINVQITLQLFSTLVPLQGKVSDNHTIIILYFLWGTFAWWHFVGRCLFKTRVLSKEQTMHAEVHRI